MSTCTACARPVLHPKPDGTCGSPSCLNAFAAEIHRRHRDAIRAEVLAGRPAAANECGVANSTAYPLVVIPSFSSPVEPLPPSRRRAFRRHLRHLFAQLAEPAPSEDRPPPSAPIPPALDAVLGQACGRCRGHCCSNGGEHAYLTVATIRRILADRPDLFPRQLHVLYLRRLRREAHRDSCLFHGPDGCGLTRELRSDTCNNHFCPELQEYQKTGATAGYFVPASNGVLRPGAFIDESGTRAAGDGLQ